MLNKFRDHLIEAELLKDERLTKLGFMVVGIVILLLSADIIYLNTIILSKRQMAQPLPASPPSITDIPLPSATAHPISATPTLVSVLRQENNSTANTISVKEYYIPLGSGSSQSADWENIPGAQASIDFGQYRGVKEIRFEASVSIPTSNQIVWVRLFNQTDKHPVWSSEVVTDGKASVYLTSAPVSYDLGTKLYQVQIKTQLQGLTNLTQSRIHITLK